MSSADNESPSLAQLVIVNQACNQFESAWLAGKQVTIEEALRSIAPEHRLAVLRELIPLEMEYRQRAGLSLNYQDYAARFPDFDLGRLETISQTIPPRSPSDAGLTRPIPELVGDYRIVERIGGGGMGTVYRAVHQRMGRNVALKVLRDDLQRDPNFIKRFDREVRVAAKLLHPNIVTALDAREQDGLHCLVSELVDGHDLATIVREQGPLTISAAIDCIVQAARGLAYAHREGVVHRDIKPANLLRDTRGVVKILDMGLAGFLIPEESAANDLTKRGAVMGTAAYMSPEQARDIRSADARSDIYSLGCTLYYLLTGRRIFSGDTTVDVLCSHLYEPVPSLRSACPHASIALEQVFCRMVAKQPADRFQSADEVIAALEAIRSVAVDDQVAVPVDFHFPEIAEAKTEDLSPSAATLDHSLFPDPAPTATRPARAGLKTKKWGIVLALTCILAVGGYRYFSVTPSSPTTSKSMLAFNGHSSLVVAPAVLPEPAGEYTIEVVLRLDTFRLSNPVSWMGPDWMAIYLSGDGYWGLARRFAGASLVWQGAERAVIGQFVHLAGVFQGDQLDLFVDGRRVDLQVSEFVLPETSGGLIIGGIDPTQVPAEQSDRYFQGAIDQVRISRGVRYRSNFTPPAELTSDASTLAVFPFDEATGDRTFGLGEEKWTATLVQTEWVLQ